ncbi:MAG TPA: hypothetical protein VF395_07850, partial [Polyangiaceae bacterium]
QGFAIDGFASFASEELETAFRADERIHDVKLVRVVAAIYLISNVPFSIVDRAFERDQKQLHFLLATRIGACTIAALLAWRLPTVASAGARDRALLIWAAALSLVNVPMILSRPPGFGGPLAATLLLLMGCTLVLPANLRYQLGSGGLIVGGYVATRVVQGPAGTAALASTAGLLFAGLAVSLVASQRLHRGKRERFHALREELGLRSALETALAEIRTLRGIVPICACCHKIRDEDGAWHRVEAYVTRHTHAQFSHGYCPACAETALS